eukprot:CAMPEP_0184313274 /NCGR_PEP_ID=MMETSP1049-20130417/61190_1 /TAXON_ID=77928 /ORGANISM="Proteomonas sulcata, Strain CCMP704" /LENGTH=84 /DNA_ID=CAMNT_0026630321 /DNA_START=111 /DNA_END=365 /DNA_ORIENTATION=+
MTFFTQASEFKLKGVTNKALTPKCRLSSSTVFSMASSLDMTTTDTLFLHHAWAFLPAKNVSSWSAASANPTLARCTLKELGTWP